MTNISQQIIDVAKQYSNLYETVANTKWASRTKKNHAELSTNLSAMMKRAGWQAPWPYCMGFCKGVWMDALTDKDDRYIRVKKLLTPGVMVTFNNCRAEKLVTMTPRPGSIFLMQKGKTGSGHAGIVTAVEGNIIKTIEGNTSPSPVSADRDREGDGVYEKSRKLIFVATSGLWLRGFIHPDDF